jgi:hypothetical protein
MNVRTTIVMDEQLLKGVREVAGRSGWNLSQAISELVAIGMHVHATHRETEFRWKTFAGKVKPGIDITDRDRLYDIMDGDE